jgi:hypothetical protein
MFVQSPPEVRVCGQFYLCISFCLLPAAPKLESDKGVKNIDAGGMPAPPYWCFIKHVSMKLKIDQLTLY